MDETIMQLSGTIKKKDGRYSIYAEYVDANGDYHVANGCGRTINAAFLDLAAWMYTRAEIDAEKQAQAFCEGEAAQ
jgi:hypothetical protein